jgi:ethanolamine utilization protein EutA (predicted chaperonin)
MVTITVDRTLKKDLENIKIQLIKREERNITHKDIFKELLYRFNVDEKYRERVKQCLSAPAPSGYEALSVSIEANEKAQLLELTKNYNTSIVKLTRCLIKNYFV